VEAGHLQAFMGEHPGAVLVDGRGEVVWYTLEETGLSVTRARAAHDGVRYSAVAGLGNDLDGALGELVHVSWGGAEVTRHAWPHLRHDFAAHDDGTIAALTQRFDGDRLVADEIVERAPDGSERVVWSSADVAAESHVNALHWDAARGHYLVSMYLHGSVLRIDRATGDVVWGLGGELGDFAFAGEPLARTHQVAVTDGGLVLFDNGDDARPTSRIVEYTLDEQAMVATEVWAAESDVYSFVFGDVHRLADGATRAAWAVTGELVQYAPGGDAVWTLTAPNGAVPGYGEVVP
jgi:hypothetical protein